MLRALTVSLFVVAIAAFAVGFTPRLFEDRIDESRARIAENDARIARLKVAIAALPSDDELAAEQERIEQNLASIESLRTATTATPELLDLIRRSENKSGVVVDRIDGRGSVYICSHAPDSARLSEFARHLMKDPRVKDWSACFTECDDPCTWSVPGRDSMGMWFRFTPIE